MGVLETLLALQERDLAMDRLAYRRDTLPERDQIVELMSELMVARMSEDMARVSRDDLAVRQSRLEAETVTMSARIADIERRLYGGTVSASRELSVMAAEVDSVRRRLGEVEDQLLEVLEESEPLDVALGEVFDARVALEAEQGRLVGVMGDAETVIDAEMALERAARLDLAARVPPGLLERYERIRQHLGGVGAAKLANGSCGGCHLALPAAERERMHHLPPDEVATCEQCGRILVP
ncbi:MAG: zinc ribbon domain-containing protein [Acidimicrobiales bacterium]